jgi:2-phospho-L-lactate guanylyltransferase
MRALLLPIKDLRQAKQRLSPFLNPEERFGLAQAMLADTIRAVRGVSQADKIFVVTNYAPAMQAAKENDWELLREEQQISESFSVDAASRHCAACGVTALLRLPLDVPLVQSADIDELLALECAAPALVIVPSRDGTGTTLSCARPLLSFHRISAAAVLRSIAPKPSTPAHKSSPVATRVWKWM